ncbi:LOW QUALITY PROTEIN: hypothetical protein CFOL_v3_27179, partial [Cephalotus follicularis]
MIDGHLVALVIGMLSSKLERGYVFDLVATPPNDHGEAACSLVETTANKDDKGKGSKSVSLVSLSIDNDWVAEHARQVQRMLVGGIKVIGVYVWVSDSCFKNSTMMLCQTLKAVAEAAAHLETDSDERLLIHISFILCGWACRYCLLPSNITSTSLKPCDFKMGKVLSSFQRFRCMYNFDLSEKDVVGSVCSFAYLNSNEPVSQAVAYIKDVLIRSLQGRLDVICDEADDLILGSREANNEISCGKPVSHFVLHELRKICYLSFLWRVFVPWLAGIYICDYLQSFETAEVSSKDHCVELMSMETPSKVLEAEVEAPSLITKSFWEVVV